MEIYTYLIEVKNRQRESAKVVFEAEDYLSKEYEYRLDAIPPSSRLNEPREITLEILDKPISTTDITTLEERLKDYNVNIILRSIHPIREMYQQETFLEFKPLSKTL